MLQDIIVTTGTVYRTPNWRGSVSQVRAPKCSAQRHNLQKPFRDFGLLLKSEVLRELRCENLDLPDLSVLRNEYCWDALLGHLFDRSISNSDWEPILHQKTKLLKVRSAAL